MARPRGANYWRSRPSRGRGGGQERRHDQSAHVSLGDMRRGPGCPWLVLVVDRSTRGLRSRSLFSGQAGHVFCVCEARTIDNSIAGSSGSSGDTPVGTLRSWTPCRLDSMSAPRSEAETDAAAHAAIATAIDLGPYALPIELRDQSPHRAKLQIACKDG